MEQQTAPQQAAKPKNPTGRPIIHGDTAMVEIARLHAEGWSIREIASELGVSKSTVHRIVKGHRAYKQGGV